jgi:RNA polymerase sigma factor (sigma-70 family)
MERRASSTPPCSTSDELAPTTVRLDAEARRTFDDLYRTFRSRVERVILARSPARGHCDDLVQEAFCRTIAAFSRGLIQLNRAIAPYLLGIAANVAADWGRATRDRRRRIDPEPIDVDKASLRPLVTHPELLCDLNSQLDGLPVSESSLIRDVWLHRIVASESEREVSNRLGISRRRLRSIEEKLRRAMVGEVAPASRRAAAATGARLRAARPPGA